MDAANDHRQAYRAASCKSGMLVNLGIGIPTMVANFVPAGMHVFFQSENGLIGTGPIPEEGMAHPTAHRRRRPAGDARCPAPARSTARCRSG